MSSLMATNFEQKVFITTLWAHVQEQENRLKNMETVQTPPTNKIQQIQKLHESISDIKIKQSAIISQQKQFI